MRNWRGLVALVAVGAVLAGCAGDDGEVVPEQETSAASESRDPWAMPLAERPPLFDPCAAIPIEAVREGAGPEAVPDEELTETLPGKLDVCAWETDEILFGVMSVWKSHADYVADPTSILDPVPVEVGGRNATRMRQRSDTSERSCHLMFFTEQGTVIATVDLVSALRYFRGERPAAACDVVDAMTNPIVEFIPEGDFR